MISNYKFRFILPSPSPGANKLTSLDLSDNLLETIAANTFDGMAKENLEVNLYENPLNCNCSMRGLKSWIDNVSKETSYMPSTFIKKRPGCYKGMMMLQLHDLLVLCCACFTMF